MKILVPISKVPDTTAKITFNASATALDETNIQFIVNPYDDWYALSKALEFKENSNDACEIVLISVGEASTEPTIRKAFSIGGDRAIRINLEHHDPANIAFQIAEYAKTQPFDLIIGGKETINYNGGIVMGMIAEYLNAPFLNEITKLTLTEKTFIAQKNIPGGYETITAQPPVVVSCSKGVAEQRNPSMKAIIAAKTKRIDIIEPTPYISSISIEKFELSPKKQECKIAKTTEELFELLKNNANII